MEYWIKSQDGALYSDVLNIEFLETMFKLPLEIKK